MPVLKVAEHGHDSVKGSVLHLSGLLTEHLWRNYPTLGHSQVEQWRHIYFMMFISNFVFILSVCLDDFDKVYVGLIFLIYTNIKFLRPTNLW